MFARKGVKSAKGRRYPHDSRDNLAAGREAWKLYWKTAEQELSSKYPPEENNWHGLSYTIIIYFSSNILVVRRHIMTAEATAEGTLYT